MRHAAIAVFLLILVGCSSDKPSAKPAAVDASADHVGTHPPAAGSLPDAGTTAKNDAATKPSATSAKLERPNTLQRPPRGGLPPELKPPR